MAAKTPAGGIQAFARRPVEECPRWPPTRSHLRESGGSGQRLLAYRQMTASDPVKGWSATVRALRTSGRTARMLRISTTLIFVLLGVGAYLVAAQVGAGTARAILQSVGGFLLGTVVVSYAYQYFLGEETENRTVTKLDNVLEQRVDDIFPGAAQYGFSGFAKEVPRTVFNELGAGDELLWLDTYSPDLRLFLRQLREAVDRGAYLRLLVIDPNAETASLRAGEIIEAGYEADSFREDTRDFLAILAKAANELGNARGTLEVRCYTDLPCIPMYLRLRQGQLTTGVTGYFLSEPSFDTVHIKWSSTPTGMLAGFQRYFEHKWEQANPKNQFR